MPRRGPRRGPDRGPNRGPNDNPGVARATPVAVHLQTSGDATDRTGPGNPYATGVVSILSTEIGFLWAVPAQNLTTTVQPTTVGATGISFDKIAEVNNFDATAPGRSASLWRARPAADFNAAINIDFGAAAMIGCAWSVVKVQNADLSGLNGAGAVVQVKTATSADAAVATLPVTFDAGLEFSGNLCLGFVGLDTANAIAPSTGFAELGADSGHGTPATRAEAEVLAGATSMSPTWTASKAAVAIVEVKAA